MTAGPSLWRIGGTQRLLAFGSLLGAVAFFAVMPFGALYLDEFTSLTTVAIGAVIGGVSLIGALGGFAGGMAVDRFGAVRCMMLGLAMDVLIFALFTVVRGEAGIIALFLLLGVSRMLFEPASKKLMSMSSDDDGRIFRLRYMTLCAGAIVGPLVGGLLYNISIPLFFATPAVLYLWFLIVIFRNTDRLQPPVPAGGDQRAPSYPIASTIRDRRLLAAIAAGLIIFVVFSQLESMIPLVMRGFFGDSTEIIFAWLLVANAAFALVLQPIIDRAADKISYNGLVLIGACGFALSFGCFALMSSGVGWLYLGIVFWTIGEGTLLPMPDMAVHQLASDEKKGAYFGLSELRYIGFFLGPILGGALLGNENHNLNGYFVVSALAIGLCVPFLLKRTGRGQQRTEVQAPSTGSDQPERTEQPSSDRSGGSTSHV